MPPWIIKFAPQAMVLAVALYWSWPALKATFPQAAAAARKAEVKKPAAPSFAANVLAPKFLPFPKDNPFLSLEQKQKAIAVARAKKAGEKLGLAAKVAAIHNSDLVLNATCIMGRQRFAVINGHVYKEKEAIRRPGDDSPTCFLTAILPHKVLLSDRGKTVQLGYLNLANKPALGNSPNQPPQ
jgi:hypothetical protein